MLVHFVTRNSSKRTKKGEVILDYGYEVCAVGKIKGKGGGVVDQYDFYSSGSGGGGKSKSRGRGKGGSGGGSGSGSPEVKYQFHFELRHCTDDSKRRMQMR